MTTSIINWEYLDLLYQQILRFCNYIFKPRKKYQVYSPTLSLKTFLKHGNMKNGKSSFVFCKFANPRKAEKNKQTLEH